jgi:UDP-glucose 4-epimerase
MPRGDPQGVDQGDVAGLKAEPEAPKSTGTPGRLSHGARRKVDCPRRPASEETRSPPGVGRAGRPFPSPFPLFPPVDHRHPSGLPEVFPFSRPGPCGRMNLFVTGGAGYIGSAFVEEALDAGHRVTVFDSLVEGHRGAVDPRATFVPGCLSDRTRIETALGQSQAQAVVHFAAFALVGESMTHPGKYFSNNLCAGLNLLEAAIAAGIRKFVFSSTCATYGIPDAMPMTEDLPQRPVNPYGESKLMFESMLRWYRQIHGLEFVAFRYFNAAGATPRFGEHHRIETHLIPNVLKVALGQAEHCRIFGTDYPTPDGTCIRDYIHIVDLAQAHLLALAPGKQGFYNLGNGGGYSVREVIDACRQISGRQIAVKEEPRRPGDPPRLIADARKAITELGWQPKFPRLEDIVRTAWEWHVKHPKGYAD